MAPKEGRYFAPLNMVLARSSIERIAKALIGEATRYGKLVVAIQGLIPTKRFQGRDGSSWIRSNGMERDLD